jgi:N-methylhydantoinase A
MLVGIDIGGTFTDIIIFDEESRTDPRIIKVPTSTKRPEQAAINSLNKYKIQADRTRVVSHATTFATNALLTHTGLAKTALITSRNFRDILEIGRQRRPEVYRLSTRRPVPLVKRKLRFTTPERKKADGSDIENIDENDVRRIAKLIIKEKCESVAVAFLHSYRDPSNELRVKTLLEKARFKGHIDLSSDIDPQYREYERTSTTVVNASLTPLISRYLSDFQNRLERMGFGCPKYIMNSDGSVNTFEYASKRPISTIESGPAAGVLASKHLADNLSLGKVITFDMGGTTAKAGTIVNGEPDLAYEFEAAGTAYHGRSTKGSGYPVRQPFIDLAEVSSGGGTIARLDETKSLKVGPESAGADPGPAAYGRGGTQPTVTDANILAGRINPSYLLGGALKLHPDLALKSIGKLSQQLGHSAAKTADNILRIVNNNMSKAVSLVTIERGRDPREYTLIAFGGAGPLHACDLATDLGIKRIIVPIHSGLFSAFGLLTAELSRTFSQPLMGPATPAVESVFTRLRSSARTALKQEGFQNYRTLEHVDLRYQGQAYEITVPYSRHANLSRLFGREHKKLYGYSSTDPVEAVNARLRAIIETPKAKLAERKFTTAKAPPPTSFRRASLLRGREKVPVFTRESLRPGMDGRGPCVIEEYDSTTMVEENWMWRIDQHESIDMTAA